MRQPIVEELISWEEKHTPFLLVPHPIGREPVQLGDSNINLEIINRMRRDPLAGFIRVYDLEKIFGPRVSGD